MRQVPHLGSRGARVPAPTTTTVFFLNRPQQRTETSRPLDIAIATTSSGRVNARDNIDENREKAMAHKVHMRGAVQICGQLWHRSLRAKSMGLLIFYSPPRTPSFERLTSYFWGVLTQRQTSNYCKPRRLDAQLLDKFNRLNRR